MSSELGKQLCLLGNLLTRLFVNLLTRLFVNLLTRLLAKDHEGECGKG